MVSHVCTVPSSFILFFFYWSGDPRDLHVLTHSFPTRRSSDPGVPLTRCWKRRSGLALPKPTPALISTVSTPRTSRSEEHTSDLQSLMRFSYAVLCLNTITKYDKSNCSIHTSTNTSTITQALINSYD